VVPGTVSIDTRERKMKHGFGTWARVESLVESPSGYEGETFSWSLLKSDGSGL